MPKYKAIIAVPEFAKTRDLDRFIDALRAFAYPRVQVTKTGPSGRKRRLHPIDFPYAADHDELVEFIDGLREDGHPQILITAEADSKDELVKNIANECSIWWCYGAYDREWWPTRIKNDRSRQTA